MEEKATITRGFRGIPNDLVLAQEAPQEQPQPEVQEQPEQEQIQAQQEESPVVEQTPEPPKETHSQKNFKALKAEAARLAAERDEERKKNAQYQEILRQYEIDKRSRQTSNPLPETDDFNIDNDALAEGKHIKPIYQEVKKLRQELEAERAESKRVALRNALREAKPDYDRVCTKENLTALELTYPHLAKAINVNDPYNAGLACYDLIKQFGIDAEEVDKTEITKAMIQQNMSKPKPGVAVKGTKTVQESPLGRASEFYQGELTDEMKKIFYKEMLDAMNGTRR